jgi:hypothetical protein
MIIWIPKLGIILRCLEYVSKASPLELLSYDSEHPDLKIIQNSKSLRILGSEAEIDSSY